MPNAGRAVPITVALVPVGCVATLAPGSAERAARLADAGASTPFASALTDLCALVATAASLWLVLAGAAIAAIGVRAPGARWSRQVHRVAPAAWRRVVLAALGTTLLAAPLPAYATSPDPGARPVVVAGSPSPRADLSGLRLPDRPSGAVSAPVTPPERSAVVVSAGDCLWSIAERALNADGPGRAGHREIAAAAHAWHVANRAAIGDDPDLIRPGMSLSPPLPPDEGRIR